MHPTDPKLESATQADRPLRALVVDLNNFARYPTMSVGHLVAVLRRSGAAVEVLSPLATGVQGYPRPGHAGRFSLAEAWLRYRSAISPHASIRALRRVIARLVLPGNRVDRERVLEQARQCLAREPDVVLISTYTMYRELCGELARLCKARGIPVLVGGNYFVDAGMIQPWLELDGISAVFGGEPEPQLWEMVRKLAAGGDVSAFPGVSVPGRPPAAAAAPLKELDALPFPDYGDFPWHVYPNRVIPIMTGRGCGWGVCSFCSDVITSSGRTFRSRTIENVLAEVEHQCSRFDAQLLVFLDLKLNSDVELWRALIDRLPGVVPDARWTASVHVDTRSDNGLSRTDLGRASAAGLARITTGLESGSQRLLDAMKKGTNLETVALFLHDAGNSGVGVRLTLMVGHPGETAEDVVSTTRFLAAHARVIERVVLNRFTLMARARLDRELERHPARHPGVRRGELNPLTGSLDCRTDTQLAPEHRAAVYRLMKVVHRINRQPLGRRARDFEGVM